MLCHHEVDTDNFFLNESEVFGLSGSGDGAAVKKNTLINLIRHVNHHQLAVHDILIVLDIWREVTQRITSLSEIV